jgi:hypothetical protein
MHLLKTPFRDPVSGAEKEVTAEVSWTNER